MEELIIDSDKMVFNEIAKHSNGIQHKKLLKNLLDIPIHPATATINRSLSRLDKTRQILKRKIGRKYSIYFANRVEFLEKTLTLTDTGSSLLVNLVNEIQNYLPKPHTLKSSYSDNDNPIKKSDFQLLRINSIHSSPKFTEIHKFEIYYTFKIPANKTSIVESVLKFHSSKSYLDKNIVPHKKSTFILHLHRKPNMHPIITTIYDANPKIMKLKKIKDIEYKITLPNIEEGTYFRIIWDKSRMP